MTLLTVLDMLNVLDVLKKLNVFNMPMKPIAQGPMAQGPIAQNPSLACCQTLNLLKMLNVLEVI